MMKIFVGLGNAWKCSQVPTPDLSTLLTKKGGKKVIMWIWMRLLLNYWQKCRLFNPGLTFDDLPHHHILMIIIRWHHISISIQIIPLLNERILKWLSQHFWPVNFHETTILCHDFWVINFHLITSIISSHIYIYIYTYVIIYVCIYIYRYSTISA